jgi:hypothetical protein
MKTARLAVTSLAVATLIGLSGCGPKSESTAGGGTPATTTTTTTATVAPAEPAAELVAAASKLADTPAKVRMTALGGVEMKGALDAKNRKSELTMTMGAGGGMVMRQVGTDLYVKANGSIGSVIGATEGKWMHIDTTKVSESSTLNLKNNDPQAAAKMLAASTKVEKTGEHTFKGTLDMTKAQTANADALKSLGSKATAVPFTAQTDAEGRLTELSIDMNSIASGAGEMTMAYSDFGTPVSVEAPPASEVVEMPAKFRKSMGA